MAASQHGRPGVALTEVRRAFERLIVQGVSNSEACRVVGINRKTGTRWRYGRDIPATGGRTLHYPPVISASRTTPISTRYLSEDERITISDLRRSGATLRTIAKDLGRSPSTISRELRRNVDPAGRYRPSAAHRSAAQRRIRYRKRRVDRDDVLRIRVQQLLAKRWSPEQISRALLVESAGDQERQLVTESIYQAIYDPRSGVVRDRRCMPLRTRRRRRKPRRHPDARRRGQLVAMTMIDDRPATVADRVEVGHWEGDYIVGAGNRSAIGTLVERTTRRLVLVHLGYDRSANALSKALISVFGALPARMRRSLTWDQGKEMAGHLDLTRATDMPVYFCHPHSPWQRGSNENMNGLLRDYFPKHTDLRCHSAERLVAVAAEINTRPRKTLDWATPIELFDRELTPARGALTV
jgi:IS30 family transposase